MNSKEFERWLEKAEDSQSRTTLNFKAFNETQRTRYSAQGVQYDSANARNGFLQEMVASSKRGEWPTVSLEHWWNDDLIIIGDDPKSTCIQAISPIDYKKYVVLKGVGIRDFQIANVPNLEIENSWIGHLTINSGHIVKISNSWIGTLQLFHCAADLFEMRGGGVFLIKSSPPGGEIPFSGSVFFDRSVHFPRKPSVRSPGPQPYRNMRSHMLRLENTPMVSLFHTLEQAMERRMEPHFSFTRALSFLYEKTSDYGSSPLRPVLWFLLLFFVSFTLALSLDGSTLQLSCVDLYGWQSDLCFSDWWGRLSRSFVLTAQSTLNPLGVFGPRGLVVAKSGFLAIWLSLHGLLSAIFVALFIFAVRRRFKMN